MSVSAARPHSVMFAALIAVGLLCLSFCYECPTKLLDDKELLAPRLKSSKFEAVNAEHCQQICTQHPECYYFTFVQLDFKRKRRHFDCNLKGEARNRRIVPRKGVTSGYSLRTCALRPVFTPLDVYKDVNFKGEDYDSTYTPDYTACQRVCTHEPFCQFFTFENAQHKCYLKNSFTVLEIPEITTVKGIYSGFSLDVKMDPPTLQYVENAPACEEHMYNTDMPGHDFARKFATCAQHCQALCSSDPRCSFFAFDSLRNQCYLKRVRGSKNVDVKKKLNVTSGFAARFCKMDCRWIKEVKKDMNFVGHELKSELVNDVKGCQKSCTANPDCQFYTFISQGKLGKCSHQRTITLAAPSTVQQGKGLYSGFTRQKSFCGKDWV